MALQDELRSQVMIGPLPRMPQLIAGADMAIGDEGKTGIAAVIVYSYPDLDEVERMVVRAPIEYPYIPGLLSFRECPVLLAAFERFKATPDLVMFDGQGIAHPRGLGLASHMGLLLGIPTIGCAKSRLVGRYEEPGDRVGEWKPLVYSRDPSGDGDIVGAVVRTREGVKPIYVSIGHMIDLETSIETVLRCLDRTRIPVPTREADRAVKRQNSKFRAPNLNLDNGH